MDRLFCLFHALLKLFHLFINRPTFGHFGPFFKKVPYSIAIDLKKSLLAEAVKFTKPLKCLFICSIVDIFGYDFLFAHVKVPNQKVGHIDT